MMMPAIMLLMTPPLTSFFISISVFRPFNPYFTITCLKQIPILDEAVICSPFSFPTACIIPRYFNLSRFQSSNATLKPLMSPSELWTSSSATPPAIFNLYESYLKIRD